MDPSAKRQRLVEGKGLVLKLGAESFSLCQEDVQRHPGSLIANLAEVQASSNTSSKDGDTVDLQKLPNSPFTDLHGALNLTESLYRHGSLSAEALQRALAQVVSSHEGSTASNSNSSSGQAARSWEQAEDTLYQTITQLLSFLIIPGPVTRWLPDFRQLPLRQARLMSFIFSCYMQNAAEALLQFKPCTSAATQMYVLFQAAAFVVTANNEGSAAPAVQVWSLAYEHCLDQLLRMPRKVLAATLLEDCSFEQRRLDSSIACTKLPVVAADAAAADAAAADAAAADAAAADAAEATQRLADFAREQSHCLLRVVQHTCGRHFARILQKAAQECDATVGCIPCNLYGSIRSVSVWVVRW